MCCKILTSMTTEGGRNIYGSKASIVGRICEVMCMYADIVIVIVFVLFFKRCYAAKFFI